MTRPTTREITLLLSKLLSTNQTADLMNALLCCDSDDRLTDRESQLGEAMLGHLMDIRPECVSVAIGEG